MRAPVWNERYRPTFATTAGTPAKLRLLWKARDMIVTVSWAEQPSALPRTWTRPPRCTVDGVTVSTPPAAPALATAQAAVRIARAATTGRRFTDGDDRPVRLGNL